MKKTIILFIIILYLPIITFSQNRISGTITDEENNNPLTGANIMVKGFAKGSYTNQQGKFTIENLKQGKYVLNISYVGYKDKDIEINIKKDTIIFVALERKAILEEEIIISAIRADEKTPTTFKNINKEKIENTNLGQDIPFLLSSTPSVIATSDAGAGVGYTGIRIRGTDIKRINITINGIPLNDPESHGVYWVNMPDIASSVDNIQIQMSALL